MPNKLSTAFKYVEDVDSGKIVTGEYVKQIVRRFIYLYDEGKNLGIYFDHKKAQKNLAFFDFIKHHKGSFATLKDNHLQLSPWQAFAQAYVFGFYHNEKSMITGLDKRLVRQSYIEVAKKNGKTTVAAGNAAFMALADNEPGAEVYIAAPSFEQSYRAYEDCAEFIRNSQFADRCRIMAKSIRYKNNFIKPVSSEPKYLEGKFAHMGLLDEIHIHENNLIFENLYTGSKSRDNPLIYMITTAGFNLNSFCYEKRKSILNNLYADKGFEDFSVFGAIYTLDELDDYEDSENWIKANPQLGISISYSDIENEIKSIRLDPTRYVSVLTKQLNMWVDSPKSFIKNEVIQRCELEFDIEDFRGCKAYGGLDLSLTDDLCAYVLLLEKEENLYLYPRFYIPRKKAKELSEQKIFNFMGFGNKINVFLSEGEMNDFSQLLEHIKQDSYFFDYQVLSCDPWKADRIVFEVTSLLGKFFDVKQKKYVNRFMLVQQNAKNLSPGMQELYSKFHTQGVFHNGNPVLKWNIRNTRIKKDDNDNWRPIKESDNDKIDGTLGSIMAFCSKIFIDRGGLDQSSIYEERGVMSI